MLLTIFGSIVIVSMLLSILFTFRNKNICDKIWMFRFFFISMMILFSIFVVSNDEKVYTKTKIKEIEFNKYLNIEWDITFATDSSYNQKRKTYYHEFIIEKNWQLTKFTNYKIIDKNSEKNIIYVIETNIDYYPAKILWPIYWKKLYSHKNKKIYNYEIMLKKTNK